VSDRHADHFADRSEVDRGVHHEYLSPYCAPDAGSPHPPQAVWSRCSRRPYPPGGADGRLLPHRVPVVEGNAPSRHLDRHRIVYAVAGSRGNVARLWGSVCSPCAGNEVCRHEYAPASLVREALGGGIAIDCCGARRGCDRYLDSGTLLRRVESAGRDNDVAGFCLRSAAGILLVRSALLCLGAGLPAGPDRGGRRGLLAYSTALAAT